PPYRPSWRHQREDAAHDPRGQVPRTRRRESSGAHVEAWPAAAPADAQSEGLQRQRASPRGTEPREARRGEAQPQECEGLRRWRRKPSLWETSSRSRAPPRLPPLPSTCRSYTASAAPTPPASAKTPSPACG